MKKLSLILFSLTIFFFFNNLSLTAEEKIISGKAIVVDGDSKLIKEANNNGWDCISFR